jgi:hypothetical protein
VTKALESPGGGPMTTNCVLEIVPGKEMPELSIVDYCIWAVQRNLIHGESRYMDALKDKYESIISLYDESGAQ